MRALMKTPRNEGLELKNVRLPNVTPGMALVKVYGAGICGTDVDFYTGKREIPNAQPLILGHEISGIVHDLNDMGYEETNVRVGDRVTVEMITGCGICTYCQRDYKLACPQSQRIGITVNGGFADYVLVPIPNLHRLPPRLSYEEAIFADPLSCVCKGIDKLENKQISSALILGGGIMGILSLQLISSTLSVEQIALVDRHSERLRYAEKWGAMPYKSIGDVKPVYGGFDVLIEATGNTNALISGLRLLRTGGVLLLLGVHTGSESLSLFSLLQNEITVIPSLCYGHRQMERAIGLIEHNKVMGGDALTSIFPLEEYDGAFARAIQKRDLKVIFRVH